MKRVLSVNEMLRICKTSYVECSSRISCCTMATRQ